MSAVVAPVEDLSEVEAPALNFQRVVVACAADVLVRQGEACSVDISGDPAAADRLKVEQIEDVVRVSGALEAGQAVTVVISGPTIHAVAHRGSGRMEVEVDVVRRLEVVNHGDGLVVARGRVGVLRATLRGAGDMQLQGLVASHAWLCNYGKGNLHAVVNGSIRVDPVGPGSIKINEHLKKPGRR